MAPVARLHHIAEGWSQHKQRAVRFYYDQHRSTTFRAPDGKLIHEMGRPYWAWVERPALNEKRGMAAPMPVGPIMPAEWEAPFYVPEKYIVRSIGKVDRSGGFVQGMASTEYFRIDYGGMAFEDTEALREYYERAVREAYALKLEVPQYGKPVSFALEVVVGRAPRSPKLAQACMAGNDWILGQRLPTRQPDGSMAVTPDKELARLITMSSSDLMTPVEMEQREEAAATASAKVKELTDIVALLRKDMAMMKAEREEAAALAARAAESEDAKQEATNKRMAKARAARVKANKAATPSGADKVG